MKRKLWILSAIVILQTMFACSDSNVAGSSEDPNVITATKTQSSSSDIEPESSSVETLGISSSVELSSSSSEMPALCKVSGDWGYNGCLVKHPSGKGDLWSNGDVKVKTDAYAEDSSKFGNHAGEFFFEKDSADNNQIDVFWNALKSASEYSVSLDGVFLYDTNYNSYYNVGFYTAGFDSNGNALAADISNWNGICVLYRGTIAPMIQLVPSPDSFLNQFISQELGITLPLPSVKLESKDEPQCFEWKDFKSSEIKEFEEEYEFELGDGSIFAEEVEKIVFRFRIWPREAGREEFTILAIGTNRDE